MLKRPIAITAATTIAALIVGVFVGKYVFEPTETVVPAAYFEQTCLLTWKGWSGDLCFLLIPMTQRGRATHDLTSKWAGRCGIVQLKQELAALPKGRAVYWNDWASKFTYPDQRVVQELIDFAKDHSIRLEQSPALQ
jgi:hypothetical protein